MSMIRGRGRVEKGHSLPFVLLTDHFANPPFHPALPTPTDLSFALKKV